MRHDRPDIYVSDKIQSLLYQGNLSMEITGTEKSMNSITREKILEKKNQIYGSENMILCVVGDTDFKRLCNFAEKNFRRSGFKILEPKTELKNETKIERRVGIDQTNLIFAFHAPKATESGSYTSQVLSCLMAGGMSSRLFQEIREKRNLAYAIKGSYSAGRRFGYNSIFVGTAPGNVDKVKQLILEEFSKIPNELSEKELRQVKEQLIGNSKISKEDSNGQMMNLLFHEIWHDARDAYKYEKMIAKVKLADVKKMAKIAGYSFIALSPELTLGKHLNN